MRPIFAALALLAAGAAIPPAAWAAAPNDIIWDTPPAAEGRQAGNAKGGDVSKETMAATGANAQQRDKNGIIWDTPAPEGRQDGQVNKTAPSAAAPDKNGIIWNAPPVKSAGARPSDPLLTPPSGMPAGRVAQTPPTTDGPCREFQTTIVIDGKQEPAHGTVCRQADGTWRVVNK